MQKGLLPHAPTPQNLYCFSIYYELKGGPRVRVVQTAHPTDTTAMSLAHGRLTAFGRGNCRFWLQAERNTAMPRKAP